METRTIIVESNREIAYSEQEESLLKQDTNIFSPAPKFPNNTWSTNIPEGILIEPGDSISLDAAQINQTGGGGSVIEFTGSSGNTLNGINISDNSAKMKLGYYVTNNQEFNFNQPKSRIQPNYDYRKNAYGSPAIYGASLNVNDAGPNPHTPTEVQNFEAFERGYPYQFIEGSVTSFDMETKTWVNDAPDSEPYSPLSDLLPSFSKGGNSVILTDSTKLYVGPRDYLGPFYIDTFTPTQANAVSGQYYLNLITWGDGPGSLEPFFYDDKSVWDFYSNDVLLTQEPGFVNPTALASTLTSKLHKRDGTADSWNVKDYEAILLDVISEGDAEEGGGSSQQSYKKIDVPAITDSTYKTLPTCTGKCIYQFLHGAEVLLKTRTTGTPEDQLRSWYCEFCINNHQTHLGRGYRPYQALMTLYSHELTSRPMYMKGMSRLIQNTQKQPMSQYTDSPHPLLTPEAAEYYTSNFYLHTGIAQLSVQTYKDTLYHIGAFGNHVVIIDNLPTVLEDAFPYYSNTHTTARKVVLGDTHVLDIQRGYIIGTNMLWNSEILKLLGEIYSDYYEVIGDTTNTTVTSKEFADAHAIRLNIGRLDDKLSVPAPPDKIPDNTQGPDSPQPTSNWKSQYLPNPFNSIFNNPAPAFPHGGISDPPYSYRPVMLEDNTGGLGNMTMLETALMGGFWGEENEILVELILPQEYTAQKAFNGELPNTGLNTPALFNRYLTTSPAIIGLSFDQYKERYWDTIPTLANGAKLGIVPLFMYSQALSEPLMGANSASGVYIGYIMRGLPEGHVQSIPVPSVGEFFGFSPSQLTTGSAQLATTQKKLRDQEYPSPGVNNLGGVLTANVITNAGSFGWNVGDYGTLDGKTTYQPGYGATFKITLMIPDAQNIPLPAIIEIVDSGGAYVVNGTYTASGVGTDFTVQVITIITNPNIGGSSSLAYTHVAPIIYYPYLNIGAEDSAIVFDAPSSKFAITQFHTPTCKGNGIFQRVSYPLNASDPEQHIVMINPRSAAICGTVSTGDAPQNAVQYTAEYFRDIRAVILGHPTRSAQAGVGILGISPLLSTNIPVGMEQSFSLTIDNVGLYKNTLLSKMGFIYEQLLPVYGLPSNDFNRGTYNEYLGFGDGINVKDKYLNFVKPFTTNAYVDATIAFSLGKGVGQSFEEQTAIYQLAPLFNLGGMPDDNEGIVNGTSDRLVARELAQKLAFPYLVVYTNIINGESYWGGPTGSSKLPAIAYLSRNFATGDFYFSTPTSWSFVADSTYMLTKVITDIRLPNGKIAPIDSNSSVIYKIIKKKAMPVPLGQQIKEMQKVAQEEKKNS